MAEADIRHILDNQKPTNERSITEYFDLLNKVTENKSNNPDAAFMAAQMSLGYLKALIEDTRKEFGTFDLTSIPALEFFGEYSAIRGYEGQLKNAVDLIDHFPDLAPWKQQSERWGQLLGARRLILSHVSKSPGCIQSELYENLGIDPEIGRTVVYYLSNYGEIQREKSGRTYKLRVPQG